MKYFSGSVSAGRSTIFCLAALSAGLVLNQRSASAQATYSASVSGGVTDSQQAIVPAAEVRLLDTGTNQIQTTKTNGAGRYIFVGVKSGTYSLSVGNDGFSTFRLAPLQVEIGATLTVN